MPSPIYWFEKIYAAIDKPKGDHANAVVAHGRYIDDLLDHYKDSLNEDNFSEAKVIAEKLREYIQKNYSPGKKFQTVKYAKKLVSNLKIVLGYNPI